jgi:hypothetical protein
MARKIIKTAMVTFKNAEQFYDRLNDYIHEIQEMGLEIEVQYQMNETHHSAIVLGREGKANGKKTNSTN